MLNMFISKSDLAQAYFPYIDRHSARHKLIGLINADPQLLDSLYALGYKTYSREFSPTQAQVIFDKLGDPFG